MTMRKIREVLRLKLEAKLSHQQTANALGVSKGLVAKYVGLAAAAHLDWPTILELDEVTLIGRLLAVPDKPAVFVMPDYADVHQALRRKGVTLMLLWEEYCLRHADQTTYGYSQFCEHYRRFARTRGCKNFCVNGHLAGDCRPSRESRNDCKQRTH
jgi:transposase